MKGFMIESSKSTPEVTFDPDNHFIYIKGQSYPENAYKFYEPLFQWVDHYFEELKNEFNVTINFELSYINTSSSKCLMMLLDKFEEAHCAGKSLTLNWYCDLENESEVECAEEFLEDLTLPKYILQRVD